MAAKNGLNTIAFCDELQAYVEEYCLFHDKHTRLSYLSKMTPWLGNEDLYSCIAKIT